MKEDTLPRAGPSVVPEGRLGSIDAFRGFAMLGMISAGFGLKDNPWWVWVRTQFNHVEWEGYVFWDLIQPSFLFVVGVSMAFSFARRRARGESWSRQFRHAFGRAFILIAIGIVLDSYRYDTLHIAFVRVLQQIALAYLAAFFFVGLRPIVQAAAVGTILSLHTLAYLRYGWATGTCPWTIYANFGAYLDALMGLPFNPRGDQLFNASGYLTFNALSSTATILLGVLCGQVLRYDWTPLRKALTMLGAAAICLLGSWTLEAFLAVPVVKKLWTASFALIAAGWAFSAMTAFYLLIDVLGYRRWAFPVILIGLNSIAVYVVHELFHAQIREIVTPLVEPFLDPIPNAAPIVEQPLCIAMQWYFCYWLYRHHIFFKV